MPADPSAPPGGGPRLPRLRARLSAVPQYSWRNDPAVPGFDDSRPLIVFDGVCVLCSAFARFVARRDRLQRFAFAAAQGSLGTALYRHLDLDTVNYESNLLLENGRAFAKLDAFAGIMRGLGFPWSLGRAASILPPVAGDPLYDCVARNRYRLFGRRDACIRPDADWQDRVIG
jgi:predicted DCC family thiol-disulfide oxidoreductase YuxK